MTDRRLGFQVDGTILERSDEGFDDASRLWNTRLDRQPRVVVRCHSVDDVVKTVREVSEDGMGLGVRGGGHSYAAATIPDEGVLIDLSAMKSIDVDASGRSVRVGAGVTCGELDAATQQHGLATTLPTSSTVGVVGAALGGGTGWLSRRLGLTLDNVTAVHAVAVDGRRVRASAHSEPDLFWGLLGAGANLAVVTSIELELHPVGPEVLAGQIIYPFDAARDLLTAYREFMAGAPRELQCLPFMFRVPPIDLFPAEHHGQPVLDFAFAHTDPLAADVVAPLRGLEEAVLEFVGPMPYVELQQSFDANLPKGQRYYSKAHGLDAVSDGVISAFVDHVPSMEGEFTATYLEPFGGAIADVDPGATAYGGRDTAYGFHAIGGWVGEQADARVMSWTRGLFDAMTPHANGGVYVNLIADDGMHRVPSAYGGNLDRVRALKSEWDPDNLLRHNTNVTPA